MKSTLRNLFLATFAIVIVVVLAGCGKSSTTTNASNTITTGKLTIGLEGTYAPYSYRQNGKLTGFDVEVATNVAKKLDLKPVFVQSKWDSLIAGLDVKKYDVVFNNVVVTPSREKSYNFTKPYMYSKSGLVVKKTSTITAVSQIKGKKTAETASSNNAVDAKRIGSEVVPVPGFAEALDLVQSGQVVGTINSREAFLTYEKANPKNNLVYINAGQEIPIQKIAGILSKSNPKLKTKIDKALIELREDGTLEKLSKKYFNGDVTNN
ncbi:transporter substrate-binding domain-containing protein [Periweissella cryptocerci]|uniref:Transporter substrate-binding domain-containing protein n=1 Tax=Periweissella cryptocerci TaxID=2506420 RepID=A0A4P6YTY2_9LACO|nr:transporter substrate-binding domain-containing protein [Periweissella cryptocerci]QBO36161.1 transporter substrate-binding domain-containing protein [Periweissella cryptocerci]